MIQLARRVAHREAQPLEVAGAVTELAARSLDRGPMRTPLRRVAGLVAATALGLSACTEPSGTLVITLDALPAFSGQWWITVSGLVTRTPPKETEVVIAVAGGAAAAVDTADAWGRFAMVVELRANVRNDLVFTAQDGTGSVSAPVSVSVVQDGVAPGVASVTPTGDGAPIDGTVEVTFSEPVTLLAGAGMSLVHQGVAVPGVTILSLDSLRLTFVADGALWRNAVHHIGFDGVRDRAGNPPAPDPSLCFVTAAAGVPTSVATDPTDDVYGLGTPAGISPTDVVEVRLAAHSGRLFGVFRYSTARGFGEGAENNAFSYVELDIDRNASTGVRTLKDSIFAAFPALASGTQAEYVIALDWFPEVADSGVVGRYVEFGTFEVLYVLLPDICGSFHGFSVPTSLFAGDDGTFDYVTFAGNQESVSAIMLDPAPDAGHVTADFSGEFAPRAAGPLVRGSLRSTRLSHRRP